MKINKIRDKIPLNDLDIISANNEEEAKTLIQEKYGLISNNSVIEEIYNNVMDRGTTRSYLEQLKVLKEAEAEVKKVAMQGKIVDRQGNDIYPGDKLKALDSILDRGIGKAQQKVDITSKGKAIKGIMFSETLVNSFSRDSNNFKENYTDVTPVDNND